LTISIYLGNGENLHPMAWCMGGIVKWKGGLSNNTALSNKWYYFIFVGRRIMLYFFVCPGTERVWNEKDRVGELRFAWIDRP